jgi:hypothetical protein
MSARSHSHVGPFFYELEEFMDVMSRGYVMFMYVIVIGRGL